jgi:serine phosphatase RsbU (regulator of sigma subunit)
MESVLDKFAADFGDEESAVLDAIEAYAEWVVGRRDADFAPTNHDDMQVRTYLLHRKLAGAGRKELRETANALQRFYRWVIAAGIIDTDPFRRFDIERPFLNKQEIMRRRADLPDDPQEQELFRLQALNEMAHHLNQAVDIQTALDVTLDTLVKVMQLQTAWIFILPEVHTHITRLQPAAAHDFVLGAYRGLPPGLQYNEHMFLCQPPDCSCQEKLRCGHLTRAVNIVECTRLLDAAAQGGDVRGLLFHASTPITGSGRALGIINVATEDWQIFSSAELQFLSTVGSQVATALERARLFDITRDQSRRLQSELEMARQVQAGLLPDRELRIPGFDIAARIEPAREMAGDFYDLIPLADGRWGILIADVSDKGAAAAMYMAIAHSILRASAQQFCTPAAVLNAANKHLVSYSGSSMFVTLFYTILDPATGTLTYANAGHDPPLLLRGSEFAESFDVTGPLLGILSEADYSEKTITMQPGDTLLAYTDGVTEAVNNELQEYGRQRLVASALGVSGTTGSLLRHILAGLTRFCAGAPQHDDITLLAVKFQ